MGLGHQRIDLHTGFIPMSKSGPSDIFLLKIILIRVIVLCSLSDLPSSNIFM